MSSIDATIERSMLPGVAALDPLPPSAFNIPVNTEGRVCGPYSTITCSLTYPKISLGDRAREAHQGAGQTTNNFHPGLCADLFAHGLVIFCHGNGETINECVEVTHIIADTLGIPVLQFEYPGYGVSSAVSSRPGWAPRSAWCRAAARIVFQYALDELVSEPEKIVVWGRSIGTGVAASLCADVCEGVFEYGSTVGDAKPSPRCVVLTSAFFNIKALSRDRVGRLFDLVSWAIEDPFDNLDALSKTTCPMLLMHGEDDNTIPIGHSTRLYDAISQQRRAGFPDVRFHPLPRTGHNDLDFASLARTVKTFLETCPIDGANA